MTIQLGELLTNPQVIIVIPNKEALHSTIWALRTLWGNGVAVSVEMFTSKLGRTSEESKRARFGIKGQGMYTLLSFWRKVPLIRPLGKASSIRVRSQLELICQYFVGVDTSRVTFPNNQV